MKLQPRTFGKNRNRLLDILRPVERKKRFISPGGRKYDWHPDLPDPRDKLFSETTIPLTLPPKERDLRPDMPPVYDQRTIGSCTANALCGIFDFHQVRQLKEEGQGPQEFDPRQYHPSSRLFLYGLEREMIGTFNEDSGAFLRDGIKSLWRVGLCREALHPYQNSYLFQRPSDEAKAEAVKHRITDYFRLKNIAEMKACIAAGLPFAFGFMVFESFESEHTKRTGVVIMPNVQQERDYGGHAVAAVGYKDTDTLPDGRPIEPMVIYPGGPVHQGYFIVRNSWGPGWGDGGHFFMPYNYFTPDLSDDFWSFRK